jgi:hypothetical protein
VEKENDMPIPGLKTHKPSGAIPWPLILIEGEEKAGKSWSIAQFSRCERIGTLYWIDLNEGAAEEYGAIEGADYEVVELASGDYHEVLRAIELVKAEAQRAKDAGEPAVALGIDSATAIWNGLKDWVSERARKSNRGRELLARDPNAEVKPTQNLWNDAGARWRTIQTHLATFPGPVIITARGKEVTDVGEDGRPIEGKKVWAVESHKELPYTATVWVRMKRSSPPTVIGARSVHAGIRPNADDPEPIVAKEAEGRLIEWLIFDALKVDPAKATVRDYKEFTGGELTEQERTAPPPPDQSKAARAQAGRMATAAQRQQGGRGRTKAQWIEVIGECFDLDCTRGLWREAQQAGLLTADVDGIDLGDRIRARAEDIEAGRVKPPGDGEVVAEKGPEQPDAAEAPPAGASGPEDTGEPGPEAPAAAEGDGPLEARVVEQTPDDDVRDGKLRKATLAALSELFGGDEAMAGAAEQTFGKPIGLVGNRALRDWLTVESQAVTV